MSDLQLDTLEAKGLIRLATFQPELEYLFRHALVQDTAYESLLKQERRALHRLVGDALEELYPERRGDLAAVLAMHFEQAGDADRAVRYLVDAARFAFDRNAIVEAFDLYSRASALLPPSSPDDDEAIRRRRVEIRLGQSRSGFGFLTDSAQIELLEPALAEVKRLGDLRLESEVQIHIALMRQYLGERPETSVALKAILDRVAEIARELNDPLIAAMPTAIIGLFQVFTGSMRQGVAALAAAAPLLEQKHDFVGSSFALVALAIGYARLGEFDKGAEAASHATKMAESGDLIAKLDALIGESTVRSMRGDLEGAMPLAMRCTQLAEETGATACVVASNFVLGDTYARLGDLGAAKIAFARGSEVADVTEQKIFRPSIHAYQRSLAASMGEVRMGGRSFEEALAEARGMGDRWGEATVIWKRAETDAKTTDGDRDHMLADYATAAAAFEEMGARPNFARVLRDWANALQTLHRNDEAEEKLRRALALFQEMGITREADEVAAELAR